VTLLKRAFRRTVWALLPRYLQGHRGRVSWLTALQCWYFQKVLGVNRLVPWPVHFASVVPPPSGRFVRLTRTSPGFMPGVYIDATHPVRLGRNSGVGPGASIVTSGPNAGPVTLGDNTWLGANSVVLPGVRLGNHVYVAAGSVVDRSFEENDILLAGVPARVVKRLPPYKGADYLSEPAQL
jgi:hypothetical protein